MRRARLSHELAARAARWLVILTLTLAFGAGLNAGWHALWRTLAGLLGTVLAALACGGALVATAIAAAVVVGPLRERSRGFRIWLKFLVQMTPYWLRDLAGCFMVGDGKKNPTWPSEQEFIQIDPRRGEPDQSDYGVHWRDKRRGYGHRLTFIHQTGEVVAVQAAREGGGTVELLAELPSEYEVDRRLANWAYASLGGSSLRWVRRRLTGWRVPLPPRGSWWLEEDRQPPAALPPPPPPTVEQEVGAYAGAWRDGDGDVVIVVDGRTRPLYHYVDHSPDGFAWGYSGSGPTDLAHSILADRLGYVPAPGISHQFRDEVVAQLGDDFVLTFAEVDQWIDDHRELFAKWPRAWQVRGY